VKPISAVRKLPSSLCYIRSIRKIQPDIRIIERKWTSYRAEFTARRSFQFFIQPSKEEEVLMREAIEQDLSRFLPPEVLDVHRNQKYAGFLEAARSLFVACRTRKCACHDRR